MVVYWNLQSLSLYKESQSGKIQSTTITRRNNCKRQAQRAKNRMHKWVRSYTHSLSLPLSLSLSLSPSLSLSRSVTRARVRARGHREREKEKEASNSVSLQSNWPTRKVSLKKSEGSLKKSHILEAHTRCAVLCDLYFVLTGWSVGWLYVLYAWISLWRSGTKQLRELRIRFQQGTV